MKKEKYGNWLRVGSTSPKRKGNQVVRFYNVETHERIWLETTSLHGILSLWMVAALADSNTVNALPGKLWDRVTEYDSRDNRLEHPHANADADAALAGIA